MELWKKFLASIELLAATLTDSVTEATRSVPALTSVPGDSDLRQPIEKLEAAAGAGAAVGKEVAELLKQLKGDEFDAALKARVDAEVAERFKAELPDAVKSEIEKKIEAKELHTAADLQLAEAAAVEKLQSEATVNAERLSKLEEVFGDQKVEGVPAEMLSAATEEKDFADYCSAMGERKKKLTELGVLAMAPGTLKELASLGTSEADEASVSSRFTNWEIMSKKSAGGMHPPGGGDHDHKGGAIV